jgi:signal transduction histidine kinase
MAGAGGAIAFAFNTLRAALYRGLIGQLAARSYPADPLLYEARTLRERLFVAANVLGIVGTFTAAVFCATVVGARLWEFRALAALFPLLVLVPAGLFGLDVFRVTAPLVEWAAGKSGASTARALGVASTVPYRLAASNLVCWLGVGLVVALGHWRAGGLWSEVAQVFAGIGAVGCGVALYQAAWHHRILNVLRDATANALRRENGEVPRSRLSVQGKLSLVMLLLVGFGGTFSLTTQYAEYERMVAMGAAQLGGEDLEWMMRHRDAAALATPGGAKPREDSPGKLFLVKGDEAIWTEVPVWLSPAFVDKVRAEPSGAAPVPGSLASATWRSLPDGSRLGVLYPWRFVELGSFSRTSLGVVFLALLGAAGGAMLLFAQEIGLPLGKLAHAAKLLGQGELSVPIAPTSTDEVGSLATALDTSRVQLLRMLTEVRELNQGLEQRVTARTQELQTTNGELNRALQALAAAQEQVVRTEKLASLGRLSAGIAHEVNNPLNFVKNALGPLRLGVDELTGWLQQAQLDPSLPDAEVARRARALAKVLGQGNAQATLDELQEVVKVMGNGVDRMSQILGALLGFSRQAPEARPEWVPLRPAVDQALALLRHTLQGRVDVQVDLGPVEALWGQPGPLGQVLMNLIKNGAEAIEGPGTLRIEARLEPRAGPAAAAASGPEAERAGPAQQVRLAITDSGKGMPPEVLQHAFEPFFTTKPVGQGTGLGLAMVHGIVQKHAGQTAITSTPGQGTTVTLVLPQPLDPSGTTPRQER